MFFAEIFFLYNYFQYVITFFLQYNLGKIEYDFHCTAPDKKDGKKDDGKKDNDKKDDDKKDDDKKDEKTDDDKKDDKKDDDKKDDKKDKQAKRNKRKLITVTPCSLKH